MLKILRGYKFEHVQIYTPSVDSQFNGVGLFLA
jgi:hypothetical protein